MLDGHITIHGVCEFFVIPLTAHKISCVTVGMPEWLYDVVQQVHHVAFAVLLADAGIKLLSFGFDQFSRRVRNALQPRFQRLLCDSNIAKSL